MVDKLMGMEVDAMPSCVGYCEQEFLVNGLFAFLHVLSIFFGLFVDAPRSRPGNAPEPAVTTVVPRP